MLKQRNNPVDILTSPAVFSVSQWPSFPIYQWLPKFPRYSPNSFMMMPLTYFEVFIAWHSKYHTVFPHTKKYRMMRSIATNQLDEVVRLLEDGFPVDQSIENKYGYNCLQIAAINNHYPLIEMLVLRGADVNKTDRRGNTALHHAIINENHEAIHSLLKNGSDPNLKNNYGFSPLDKANNNPNITSFIKSYNEPKLFFPRFRVKLRIEERLRDPLWRQLLKINIYSAKVRPHLLSKWQFDLTDSRPLEDLLKGRDL